MREILLKQGDCLELMKKIPDKSINMILCDLPYGTTQLEWDTRIPFEPLWKEYNRIIKDNGAILLFACQPFQTDLINSNRRMFRYEIIWKKTTKSGFLDAKRKPLKAHENIVVFYKHRPTYNPQFQTNKTTKIGKKKKASKAMEQYRKDIKLIEYEETGKRYPIEICNVFFDRYINLDDNSGIIVPLNELYLTKEKSEAKLKELNNKV